MVCAETSSRAALAGDTDAPTAPVTLINVLRERSVIVLMRMSAAGLPSGPADNRKATGGQKSQLDQGKLAA